MKKLLPLLALLCLCSCYTVEYDLGGLPFAVSAQPPPPERGPGEAFRVQQSSFLYVHGLFGRKVPDVAAMLREAVEEGESVHDFRFHLRSGFSHWLLTHLSLGLIRSRSVVVEGIVVPAAPESAQTERASRSPENIQR